MRAPDDLGPINQPVQQPPPAQRIEWGEELHIGDLLVVVGENKWLILFITLLVLGLGMAWLFTTSPLYSTDALLQIEEEKPRIGALEEMTSLYEGRVPVSSEIEILRSRSVLGQVVDTLHLDILAAPRWFPLVGHGIARRFPLDDKAARTLIDTLPWLDLQHYAWDDERIKVETFDIPQRYIGTSFTLQAEAQGHYTLFGPDGATVIEGRIGETARANRGGEQITLFLSELKGRPGTRFRLVRISRNTAIAGLQARLQVKQKGKAYAFSQSGILEMRMEGPDPSRITEIVNRVGDVYVRQNVERRSAEAQKTLVFLQQQLPTLKEALDAAEAALNSYRLQMGSVDLPKETQVVLEKDVTLQSEVLELRQKRKELLRRFTAAHPTIAALDTQITQLEQELEKVRLEVEHLPKTQQTILRLTRDMDVNSSLYTSLLNSAQELRVAKAGTIGNARIVDYAVIPEWPTKPKKTMVLGLSLFVGLFLGIVLAFLRKSLHRGVEDPDIIERQLGVPVYVTIPHSDTQDKISRRLRSRRSPAILANLHPEDEAVESLRSLRTTLHFALIEANTNVVMITGPSPGVGKTFVSANFAVVLASLGKRVVLVDADMRKGYLNQYFGIKRSYGLSELISDDIDLQEALHDTGIDGLTLIPTGAIPPNPSELLLHERFATALERLDREFDYVIIDTPPALAVTDAAIVGRLAAATLMVVKAGIHPLREIEFGIKRLTQAGVGIKGVLFNDIEVLKRRYGYGKYYGSYAYHYSYSKK